MNKKSTCTEKLLSVIIPVYNAGNYLLDTLQQIENQTAFDRMEVILVNDGSTDNSREICEAFCIRNSGAVLKNQPNRGVSSARNEGIKLAHGRYVAFIDADDGIEPNLYDDMLSLMENQDADIGIVNFKKVFDSKKVKLYYQSRRKYTRNNYDEILIEFLKGNISPQIFDKIFKRELISDVYFPVNYRIGEDMYFVYQALARSRQIVIDYGICGYLYHIRNESVMNGTFGEKYFDLIKLSKLICDDINTVGQVKSYAEAHLIHEECKTVEYIYRKNALEKYGDELDELRERIKAYPLNYAKRYLNFKQFCGFVLMRYSPKLYLFFHKTMKIG